ncbi:hypothetical protein F5887DRAFT_1069881 [Amanita rubescens]|nr:hypothetical protein F5887DRAFT_1069881 [Amanita rubescens]
MRFIKSFVHKRARSEPTSYSNDLPKSVVIDKAYNDLFAPDHPCHDIDLENVNLRRLSSAWALSHSRLVLDLNLTQSELHLECERNKSLLQHLRYQSALLEDMKQSLDRHEHLISILSEIGLCEGIITNAHSSVSEGQDSIHAIVKAIKEAAAVPGSNWAVILPAISGPRTQAEYIAALRLSLNIRKELRKCKKIAKFWKSIAQQQSTSSVVTPSVSALSSIYEKLSPERRDAVNALVERRKKEGWRNPQSSDGPLIHPKPGHLGSLAQLSPASQPGDLTNKESAITMIETPTSLEPPNRSMFSSAEELYAQDRCTKGSSVDEASLPLPIPPKAWYKFKSRLPIPVPQRQKQPRRTDRVA